jgi:hypothetical protein
MRAQTHRYRHHGLARKMHPSTITGRFSEVNCPPAGVCIVPVQDGALCSGGCDQHVDSQRLHRDLQNSKTLAVFITREPTTTRKKSLKVVENARQRAQTALLIRKRPADPRGTDGPSTTTDLTPLLHPQCVGTWDSCASLRYDKPLSL